MSSSTLTTTAGRARSRRHVHELGNDMDDLFLAIEAQQPGLPRIALAREDGWLTAYAESQPDSLWLRAKKDASEQIRLMQLLLAAYARREKPKSPPEW